MTAERRARSKEKLEQPFVTPDELDRADREIIEALEQLADIRRPARLLLPPNELTDAEKIALVRAVIGPAPSRQSREEDRSAVLSPGRRLLLAFWPFQVFWIIPALSFLVALTPGYDQKLAAVVPALAWLVFAILGRQGIPTDFHLRVAVAWQAWFVFELYREGAAGFMIELYGPLCILAMLFLLSTFPVGRKA